LKKPQILKTEIVCESRLFTIERLHLRFANGVEREFERFLTRGHGAVMVVPLLDDDTVLLIREYAAGLDSYELTLPKGLIDAGETVEVAANRELQEEIGYGAGKLQVMTQFATAPGYHGSRMTLLLAQELCEKRLDGDEPEELEVVPWPISTLDELIKRDDFNDARSIAALFMVKQHLKEVNC